MAQRISTWLGSFFPCHLCANFIQCNLQTCRCMFAVRAAGRGVGCARCIIRLHSAGRKRHDPQKWALGAHAHPPSRISAAAAQPQGHTATTHAREVLKKSGYDGLRLNHTFDCRSPACLSRLSLTLDNDKLLWGKLLRSRILSRCCWAWPWSAPVQSDLSVSCSVVFLLEVHLSSAPPGVFLHKKTAAAEMQFYVNLSVQPQERTSHLTLAATRRKLLKTSPAFPSAVLSLVLHGRY